MQLHTLKRKTKNKKHRIIGRGGKHAKTAGRGTKGQSARAGNKKRPELRDIIKKLPKRRGRGKNIFQSFEIKPAIINVGDLQKAFPKGGEVTPLILVEKKIINTQKGKIQKIKILSDGELSVALTVKDCLVSLAAKTKIEKAGGAVQ